MKAVFKDYFRELIGESAAEQFFSSIEKKETRRGIRVNSLKSTRADLSGWLSSQCYEVENSPFSSDGLAITGRGERLALKLPYHAGCTYPQDESSMFAIELLDPQPGETILDMTAAPGGKTTHIAQRMENTGVLVANDMDSRRLRALHSNLERLGIWNCVVTRMMAHKLSLLYTEAFDRVLLDPSCSGEGLLVTRDGKPNFWSRKSLKRYTNDQISLLCSAFRCLKSGGRLVYSTCTLNDLEDDGVVQRLLKKFPEAKVEDFSGGPEQIGGLMGIRFWPHITGTKGFFCIAITKTESLNFPEEDRSTQSIRVLNKNKSQQYISYVKKNFGVDISDKKLTLRDDHLFILSDEIVHFELPPHYSLSFPLLKVSNENRPTHCGAIWLALKAYKGIYELSREEVLKIFERQPVKYDGEERGLRLARFEKFPVGVAKLTEKGVEVLLPRQN